MPSSADDDQGRANVAGAGMRRSDLAKIHIAKKELNLTDEAYRDMLHLHFQVASAKDLKPQQVVVLLNKFRAKGWRPKPAVMSRDGRMSRAQGCAGATKSTAKSAHFKEITGPNARQKKYILALWNALGYDVAKLDARCKKQFNVERFEWLKDEHDLFVLVTDLRKRCENVGIDPEP